MRYPEDYINKITCGDCLDILKGIPDNSIDLVLTDPPYGVRKTEEWDEEELFRSKLSDWFKEINRVSKLTIWFCAGKMIPAILEANPAPFFRLLFWNKPPGSQYNGASHNNLWYSTDPILLFGEMEDWKGKGKDSLMEFSSFDSRTVPTATFGHPTTKPYRLLCWLLRHHSNLGDLILDPFIGSGSTAVACRKMKRDFIGIELNPKYCEIARDRLRQVELFKMQQSKRQSFIESIVNISVGYLISVISLILILPVFGVRLPVQDNFFIGIYFTFISIIRSYLIRRYFNHLNQRKDIS